MNTIQTIILVLLGAAGLLAAEGIYYLVIYRAQHKRSELRRRLKALGSVSGTSLLLRQRRISHNPTLERWLKGVPGMARLEEILFQTELDWTVSTVLFLMALIGGLTSFSLMLLLRGNPMSLLFGILAGVAVPLLVITNSRQKRSEKLSAQMPDALDMMVRSLRAGHGLPAAFKLIAGEMPVPIAEEFGRCFEEQNMGIEIRDAVRNLAKRAPGCVDLKFFAVSIIVQRETGGNLVELLERLAGTIRERYKFYGKLRALTAEGKISCLILGALPFVCLCFLLLTNPKHLEPLVTTPMGYKITFYAIVSWIIGVVWMKRLAKVDV